MSSPPTNQPKSNDSSNTHIEPQITNIENYLRWVSVERSDQIDAKSGEMIWWPALLFDSLQALQILMPRNSLRANRLRSAIFLETKRKRSTDEEERKKYKVAFLLGEKTPKSKSHVVAISPHEEQSLVRDFYDYTDEIEEQFSDNKNWKQAYDRAIEKLAQNGDELDYEGDAIATVPVFDPNTYAPSNMVTEQTASSHTETSKSVSSLDKKQVHDQQRSSHVNTEENSGKEIFAESSSYEMPSHQSPQASGKSQEPITVISPGNASVLSTSMKDKILFTNPRCSFHQAWKMLEDKHGWIRRPAKGKLVPYYYLSPRVASATRTKDFGKKGVDFFASDQDLCSFLRNECGWEGNLEEGKKPARIDFNQDLDAKEEKMKDLKKDTGEINNTITFPTPEKKKSDRKVHVRSPRHERPIPDSVVSSIASRRTRSFSENDERRRLYGTSGYETPTNRVRRKKEKSIIEVGSPTNSSPSMSLRSMTSPSQKKSVSQATYSPSSLSGNDDPSWNGGSLSQLSRRSQRKRLRSSTDSSNHSIIKRQRDTRDMVHLTLEKVSSPKKKAGDTWRILSDEEAWTILQKRFDFKRTNSLFVTPGRDRNNKPVSHETLFEVRQQICKFGLSQVIGKEVHKDENDEQLAALEKWIAFAHIQKLQNKKKVQPFTTLTCWNEAFRLLKKLGFKARGSQYIMPWTTGNIFIGSSHVEGRDYFENSTELWVYLARVGLWNCPIQQSISNDDQYALEFFLADSYRQYWNVFCPTPLQEEDLPSFEVPMNLEAEMSDTESSKPNKLEFCTQNVLENSVLSQPDVTNENEIVHSIQVQSDTLVSMATESKKLKNKSEKETKNQNDEVNEGKQRNSSPVEDKGRDSLTSLSLASLDFDGKVMSDMIFSNDPVEKIEDRTNREVLNNCLEKLSVKFVENSHYFMGKNQSQLGIRSARIESFLNKSINEFQPERDGTSSIMYVCGRPGTGKTSMIECCVRKVIDNNSNSSDDRIGLDYLIVNGPSVRNEKGCSLMEKVVTSFMESPFNLNLVDKFKKRLKAKPTKKLTTKNCLILVIDEIDNVVENRSSSGSFSTTDLGTLFRMASDPQCRLILIGISNQIGNTKLLPNMKDVDEEVVFTSYTKDDITSIINKRLSDNTSPVVLPAAIELVSRKVSATSGDARKALEIMSKAVQKCLESLSEAQKDKTFKNELVKIPHVMKALKDGAELPFIQTISKLPQSARVVLCVAMTISQASTGRQRKVIKLSELRSMCTEATYHKMMDPLTLEQMVDIVRMLIDAGILIVGNTSGVPVTNHHLEPTEWPLQLGVQLEDVEIALEKSLFQQQFYKSLFDFIKSLDEYK